MPIELKPCPFCSGEVSFHQDPYDCPGGCHFVECKNCGTFDFSNSVDPENKFEILEDLRKAIAGAWNKRSVLEPGVRVSNENKINTLISRTGYNRAVCADALINSDWDLYRARWYILNHESIGKLLALAEGAGHEFLNKMG